MPTHTRLSLQPKSREPRKTAGGIRGQRKAGVRRQTAVTAMPLKMRPTGLGSGIDKDRADYTVFTGEWEVGRIYETRGGPDNLRWFLVDDRQRSDDTLGSRGDVRGSQGAISKELGRLEEGGEAGRDRLGLRRAIRRKRGDDTRVSCQAAHAVPASDHGRVDASHHW